MKKILLGLLMLPSLTLANIKQTNILDIPIYSIPENRRLSDALIKEIYDAKEYNLIMHNNWEQYIKRPKHTSLNEELKIEYQKNFQILKKCYVKPQDNLQDIMVVMGNFINAYADIVYGKEIVSYNQELQDYDRILSNTTINKEANPEECLKARDFFEDQLM